jgi:hypothetical protein
MSLSRKQVLAGFPGLILDHQSAIAGDGFVEPTATATMINLNGMFRHDPDPVP